MSNELQKKKPEQKEKDTSLYLILISSLAIILLLLVEFFLMIVTPQMLPAIAVVGVVIVGCAYLDLSTYIKRVRKKEKEQEEQYASILKSEKASYLLIRKYFDEIEEQLTLLEDKFSEPFQEVVAAQKATAKVTINRSKENADALMNSNDKLLEMVFSLESKLEEIEASLSESLADRSKDQNVDILHKQTEMSNQMRELELSLRNEILQAVNKLSSVSPQVVMAAPQMMQMQQPVSMPVQKETEFFETSDQTDMFGSADNLGELGELPDFVPLDAVEEEIPDLAPDLGEVQEEPKERAELEPLMDLEPIAEPELFAEPEPVAEPGLFAEPEPVAEPVVEELPPMPDLSDPNKMMSPNDIAALLANMTAEAPVVADEAVEEEPLEELEPELTTAYESEPVAKEPSPVPDLDLSDPNKMMSPDDIEALLASMAADTASAASLPDVEEEEDVPEPVVEPEEEKPPMPDLSDPNRQMSPDEIAALFANMG